MAIQINGTSGISGVDGSAGTPALQGSDSNTGISFGTDTVNINTGGTTRATVDSSGNLGIGTTSPVERLTVDGGICARHTSDDSQIKLSHNGTIASISATYGSTGAYDPLAFFTSDTERARIDTSGRLLVGTSTARSNLSYYGNTYTPQQQIEASGSSYSNGVSLINYSASGYGSLLTFGISKSNTKGTNTAVINGDELGSLHWVGNDGTNFVTAAVIRAEVDGTPGTNDMPGRINFYTTADGASTPTERMRISADGSIRNMTGLYADYSGSSANVCIDSSGHLTRGSSSIRYKTQVEDLEDQYADALLECRPVWYRSTSKNDNPEWSFYGLIAEEVAEIDPRLVQWRTTNPVVQENGSVEHEPCEPVPEGISYDRFVPHLLNLIKRQKEAIETLETRVAQLEGGAS